MTFKQVTVPDVLAFLAMVMVIVWLRSDYGNRSTTTLTKQDRLPVACEGVRV
ncbi:hypothetical protein [Roseibium sp. RKSG952]|uniref:hypothetical protein n=1 Tax=Roseibium sp. RKSG952 TaxID=2529384 RepID=UPI0012BBEA92|nr:hypothetical protein [Roseibium sp. RKSG952]